MNVGQLDTARLLTTKLIGFDRLRLKKFSGRYAKVLHTTPSCWSMEGLIALPGRTALYDLEGQRVDRSEERYLADPSVVPEQEVAKYERNRSALCPPTLELGDALANAKVESRPTVFLGYYGGHYGHFLTDWSSRLWSREVLELEGLPAMLPYPAAAAHRSKPFMAAMFQASGLDRAATNPIEQPTIFENVTVVENAFQLGYAIYSIADCVHRKIARATLSGSSPFSGKKIYLSRSKLTARLREVEGEEEIEMEFGRLGFISVSPESLTFKEQIEIFNSASVIVGFAGSAFHTGMFSLRRFTGLLIVLCDDGWPNYRLVLQNAIKKYSCVFMRVSEITHRPGSIPVVRTDLQLLKIGLQHLGEGVL